MFWLSSFSFWLFRSHMFKSNAGVALVLLGFMKSKIEVLHENVVIWTFFFLAGFQYQHIFQGRVRTFLSNLCLNLKTFCYFVLSYSVTPLQGNFWCALWSKSSCHHLIFFLLDLFFFFFFFFSILNYSYLGSHFFRAFLTNFTHI